MPSRKLLMVLGGAYHDFEGFAKHAGPLMEQAGYDVEQTYDHERLETLTGSDQPPHLVLVYTSLGGANDGTRVGTDLRDTQVTGLRDYVASGGGLLVVHCGSVSGPECGAMRALVGGWFERHPKPFSFTVYPTYPSHPITDGIEAFEVFDEFYVQGTTDDITVHAVALLDGRAHPMVWSRSEGNGRVAYVANGHDTRSWAHPSVERLLVQAARWCVPDVAEHN